MQRIMPLAVLAVLLIGCEPSDPENSPTCAITMMAAANRVLEQIQTGARSLSFPPDELVGTVAARVVGFGTRSALAAGSPEGAVVGYDGDGFPTRPGFGLAVVEDSAEVFKGVLIFDKEPPQVMPQIGTVSNATTTLPLFGARISWAAVSNDRCPLFGPIDAAPQP